jgi:dTMP kinase
MKNFISFEGIDGCGKTTQISLVSKYLDEKHISNTIVREPGDTRVSEMIRKILLDKENKIFSNTEALLFLAARSQLVNEIILPKLKNNEFVLCDRYLDSTAAYQGFGHNLDLDLINSMNKFSTNNLLPSLTIIFDINPKIAMERIKINNLDRMESRGIDYFNKVRDGYIQISNLYPERCQIIDCNEKDIMSVYNSVVKLINLYL